MSHEIKTHAANRVWSLLVSDHEDEIDEYDIQAIEQEAATLERRRVVELIREQIAEYIVGHAAASAGREVDILLSILDGVASAPAQGEASDEARE